MDLLQRIIPCGLLQYLESTEEVPEHEIDRIHQRDNLQLAVVRNVFFYFQIPSSFIFKISPFFLLSNFVFLHNRYFFFFFYFQNSILFHIQNVSFTFYFQILFSSIFKIFLLLLVCRICRIKIAETSSGRWLRSGSITFCSTGARGSEWRIWMKSCSGSWCSGKDGKKSRAKPTGISFIIVSCRIMLARI